MVGLSLSELLIVLSVGLLLFGNLLPQMARSVGKGYSELRQEVRKVEEDVSVTAH